MSTDEKAQNAASISTAKLATSVPKDTTVKFRSAGQPAGITSKMLGDNRYSPNPAPATSDPFVNFSPNKLHKLEQEDRSSSISDTDDSCSVQLDQTTGKPVPAPGKKTRGRVKIQMEYIQNKLRRYTTFSKRKSGMMKKVKASHRALFCYNRALFYPFFSLHLRTGLRTQYTDRNTGDAAGGLRDGPRLHLRDTQTAANDHL